MSTSNRKTTYPPASPIYPQAVAEMPNHDIYTSEDSARDEQLDQFGNLSIETEENTPFTASQLVSSPTSLSTVSQPNSPVQSRCKKAFEDVGHFAGGLITHPYESTKHFSVLRHSHGLVYYKGSSTNLAITIFSDRPLPVDRTFWLQKKGWSGNTGLKAGALLGTKSSWINVTPTLTATADQLSPTDEKAWQRDIKKFLDKAPKELRHHQVRETDILRIPAHADDGYLRVILCTGEKGKKVLCPSPVFRLASTSTSASSVRGASLSTLPVELGLKVASTVGRIAASNTIAPLASPVISQIQPYQPGFLTQQATGVAYGATGIQDRIDQSNKRFDNVLDSSQSIQARGVDQMDEPGLLDDDQGPQEPFPIKFSGRLAYFSMNGDIVTEKLPTLRISNVSDEILLCHEGVFFGWTNISIRKTQTKKQEISVPEDWLQSVISIIPDPDRKTQVVRKKIVVSQVIEEFELASSLPAQFDAKVSVLLMGFLHPSTAPPSLLSPQSPTSPIPSSPSNPRFPAQPLSQIQPQQVLAPTISPSDQLATDLQISQTLLSLPSFSASSCLTQIQSAASQRSLTDRYVDLRASGQRHVDRILPLHKVGVRTQSAGTKDRLVGNAGVTVLR